MTNVVNQNAFSDTFKQSPNFSKIIAVINNSPTLVNEINTFASNSGNQITLGSVGIAETFRGSNGNMTIEIDPNYFASVFTNSLTADSPQQFATTIGHELGHALLPNGYGNIDSANNPDQAAQIGLTSEGVALSNEYAIAKEFGTTMHSGSVLQSTLDQIVSNNPTADPSQISSLEIAAGANYYSNIKPGNTQLFYPEYYKDTWILDKCGGANLNVDWTQVTHGEITYTNNPDGSCSIPNISNIKLLDGTSESISGKISNTGAPISLDLKLSNSSGTLTQENIANANGSFDIVKYAADGVTQAISDLYDATGKVLKEIVNPSISFADFSNVAASALATQVIAQFLFKNNLPASAAAQAFSNVTVQALSGTTLNAANQAALGKLTPEGQFIANYGIALANIAAGIGGSVAGAKLFQALGFSQQAGSVIGGAVSQQVVAQIINNASGTSLGGATATGSALSSDAIIASLANAGGAAIGTYLGADLSKLVIGSPNQGASFGGAVGSAIGTYYGVAAANATITTAMAETTLGIIIPGIGALIGAVLGSFLGSLIGNLFGGGSSVGPNANAPIFYNVSTNSWLF